MGRQPRLINQLDPYLTDQTTFRLRRSNFELIERYSLETGMNRTEVVNWILYNFQRLPSMMQEKLPNFKNSLENKEIIL